MSKKIKLQVGDTIRNKGSSNVYLVAGVYGDRATAVRTVDVTNPREWERLQGSFFTDLETEKPTE